MGVTSRDPGQCAEPVKSAAPQTEIEKQSFMINNVIWENMSTNDFKLSPLRFFLAGTLAETFIPLKKWRERGGKKEESFAVEGIVDEK